MLTNCASKLAVEAIKELGIYNRNGGGAHSLPWELRTGWGPDIVKPWLTVAVFRYQEKL